MIIKFPAGQEVDIIFDETQHSYQVAHKLSDGSFTDYRPTHGATAPLAVVPKDYLKPWAAKLSAEALMEALRSNPLTPEQFEQFFMDKKAMDENLRTEDNKPVMSSYKFRKTYPWFSEAKTAYKRASKEATEIGTWLHSAIEHYYKSNRTKLPQLTDNVKDMWQSFIEFDNYYKPKPDDDGLEFIVYSLSFGYSGQGDFRGIMNGKKVILDWKTTNRSYQNKEGITVDYFFQLGGLAYAEYERTGKWVDDLGAVNFPKEGGNFAIVWASDFGMSPQDCAKAYISCFNTYHMIETWDYKYSKK